MEIDGHDHEDLKYSLSSTPWKKNTPSLIIANTIKGKGVGFMENKVEWHYKSPNHKQLSEAFRELGVV